MVGKMLTRSIPVSFASNQDALTSAKIPGLTNKSLLKLDSLTNLGFIISAASKETCTNSLNTWFDAYAEHIERPIHSPSKLQ